MNADRLDREPRPVAHRPKDAAADSRDGVVREALGRGDEEHREETRGREQERARNRVAAHEDDDRSHDQCYGEREERQRRRDAEVARRRGDLVHGNVAGLIGRKLFDRSASLRDRRADAALGTETALFRQPRPAVGAVSGGHELFRRPGEPPCSPEPRPPAR